MDPRDLLSAIESDPLNTPEDVAWWTKTLAASIARAARASHAALRRARVGTARLALATGTP